MAMEIDSPAGVQELLLSLISCIMLYFWIISDKHVAFVIKQVHLF